MSFTDKKRRQLAKRELRKTKPYLMGWQLEEEVDKVLGIADSGKMDWRLLIESGKDDSAYSTPESVYEKLTEVASKYHLREWALYWFYSLKVNKLKASGRSKTDYLALLEESAQSAKELSYENMVRAVLLHAKDLYGKDKEENWAKARLHNGLVESIFT
jgi:hypothetical protein